MRGVTLFGTSLALAVPAILWPPKPVRAAELVAVSQSHLPASHAIALPAR
jgi:hypothetical protein